MSSTSDHEEEVTLMVIAHTPDGYHVEVDGVRKGTTFPEIHSALLWVTMLAATPAIRGVVDLTIVDRKGGKSEH